MIEEIKAAVAVCARQFQLWEWANGKLSRAFSRRPTFRPECLQELWSGLMENRYSDGDFVEIRPSQGGDTYWYVQEWLPRSPGQLWLDDELLGVSIDKIANALNLPTCPSELSDRFYFRFFHSETSFLSPQHSGCSLSEQGFAYRTGIYRPPLLADQSESTDDKENQYALLGLVTNKEYFIDLAFPIVVSKSVYQKVIQARHQQNAVEFEGVIQLREKPMSALFDSYLTAVGAKQDEEMGSLIRSVIGLRSFLGYATSPLDISVRTHSSHPIGTIRVEGHNGDVLSSRDGVILLSRFLVDNPVELPARLDARHFLLGRDEQFGTELHPITDSDGRQARFMSDAPVMINPQVETSIIDKLHESVASDAAWGAAGLLKVTR